MIPWRITHHGRKETKSLHEGCQTEGKQLVTGEFLFLFFLKKTDFGIGASTTHLQAQYEEAMFYCLLV